MILVLSESEELVDSLHDALAGTVPVERASLNAGVSAAGKTTAVAVIDGVDDPARAFMVAGRFDDDRPDITVVLYISPDPDLLARAMQAGVRDILAPGSDASRIRESVKRGLELADRRQQQMTHDMSDRHRLIIVLSPKGGSGKTTVASNLAVGLATRVPKQVVLVDGDLQFGDVGNALRLLVDSTIADAVAGGLHDATEVKVHLTAHRSGVYALCAPESPGAADEISSADFARAVSLLLEEFKYVIVDTDPGLSERTLTVLDLATDIILIGATDVAAVRGLRKTIEALDRIGLTTARRHFVLNRADAKVGLEVSDIADTVGLAPDVLMPSSRSLPVSLNQGTPVLEINDSSPAVGPLWDLVNRFEPDPESEHKVSAKRAGGLFGRR